MDPDHDLIESFLRGVWNKQPSAPVAFLSTKDWLTGTWTDHAGSRNAPVPAFGDIDLYFSPHLFTGTRRTRRMSSDRGRWLYADLDEVDPRTITPVPTLAWETSPGRYQCLWLLDRDIPRRRLEQLNQRMTYYVGADKGGWSLTKVLRVPGSVSHKRDEPFRVRLISLTTKRHRVHSVTDLTELLRDVETSGATSANSTVPAMGDIPTPAAAIKRNRRKMTARAKQLIRVDTILQSDDRSARMWELMVSLVRSRVKPVDILAIVRSTKWNKYAGQRRELAQLWREINKATAHVESEPAPVAKPPPDRGALPNTLMYDDFMRREWERPEWLVDSIWTAGAYGILAGEYKSFKTMLLLDLALSVASGEPFLTKHRVLTPGMVCYVHEEGRPWSIHERMLRIAHMKGLTDTYDPATQEITFRGRSLPLAVTSLPRLNLRDEESQAKLAKHIATYQPRLVILETFYLLSGGASESNIEELSPMLEYIAHLSHEYGCAIILSHHFHKSRDDGRTFDRTSGSNVFLRWYESAMFVERSGAEEDNTIKVHTSHRDGAYTKQRLQLVWDSDDDGQSFAIHHLADDPDADAEERAAEVIVEMGQSAIASMSSEQQLAVVRYVTSLTKPTSVMAAKRTLGLARNDQVVAAVRKINGFKVETIDNRRMIVPE